MGAPCPVKSHIRCQDGSCARINDGCTLRGAPITSPCAEGETHCGLGNCVPNGGKCTAYNGCPKDTPFQCSNCRCAAKADGVSALAPVLPVPARVELTSRRPPRSVVSLSAPTLLLPSTSSTPAPRRSSPPLTSRRTPSPRPALCITWVSRTVTSSTSKAIAPLLRSSPPPPASRSLISLVPTALSPPRLPSPS